MKTVAYIRLSRDDGNDESVSVTNQRKIINDYAKNHHIKIDETMIDDGWSGYSFDRPAFNKLKRELEDGLISTVLVKDISRIGRHNAKTLLFVENMTKLNAHLIGVSDNYDNLHDDDMLGIKTWFNEKYVKDTSRKVRATISTLQKSGEWIGTIPYGYKRDFLKKKTFYIDPESSQYVKRIFDMYIKGYGSNKIAKIFQIEGIPTPTQMQNIHRQEAGLESNKESPNWSPVIIRRILSNEFYIGTLITNKTMTKGIKGKKIFKDKSDNYVFENHHEAIIDRGTFNLVQEIRAERSKNSYKGIRKNKSTYTGMLFCGDCGRTMSPVTSNQSETYYICRTYHLYGAKFCNNNKVYQKDLNRAVQVYLGACRSNLANEIKHLDSKIKSELKQSRSSQSIETLEALEKRLNQLNSEVKSLISQKTREMIKSPDMSDMIEETYQEMINEKMIAAKNLKSQIELQKNLSKETKGVKDNLNKALSIFDNIIASDNITREQAQILIKKINVYYKKGMVINMKGNLNAVVNPNAIVEVDRKIQYIKETIDEMYKLKEFHYKELYEIIKSKGYNIGYYRKFKPIMDKLIQERIIKKKNNTSKAIVVKPMDMAYNAFNLNTNVDTDPCRRTNSDSFGEILKISTWIKDMGKTHYISAIK